MTESTAPENEDPTKSLETNEPEPTGLLALVGLWEGIMTDEEVDEFVRHIYAEREKDKGLRRQRSNRVPPHPLS